MSSGQYPFWKDREVAYATSEVMQCRRDLEETRMKLKNIKCPKCGHIFSVE